MGQILVVNRPDEIVKGPGETRDVTIDWSGDLPAGVVITGSAFAAEPGLTVGLVTFDDTGTAVRLSGGQQGRRYEMSNSVDLSNSEVYTYPFTVLCKG